MVSATTEHHDYIYAGGTLLRDVITTTVDETTTTQILDFRYDENGFPYELIRTVGETTTSYYYITNLQGDVMHLVDGDGTAVASYTYDPYGNILTATGDLAEVNPLRYRGYYYDEETGFYYVSSRYYDPEIARFINADAIELLGVNGDFTSINLFVYCGNNPIIREDKGGHFWNIVAGAVVGAVISTITQVVDNLIGGNDWHDGLALTAACGAITGALAATGAPRIVQSIGSGVVSALTDWGAQKASGKGVEWEQVVVSGLSGALSGWIGGDGIRHKDGNLAKAQNILDYTKEGINSLVFYQTSEFTFLLLF